ncbi:hypothetical protein CDV31_016546 [Fusarium ambrosium]|uniref:AAA+ ATPase domain-containing protein n=1 Tax=Fusarium ambrosium TaxID=131363 RepID=A0A428S6P6_9HYPO|nr:hypothetical protein CDV31_016546 [Fusarium ambrosium]
MSSAPDTSLPLASHLLSTPPSSSGTENGEMALAAHRVDAIEKHVEERLPDNHPTEVGDAEAQDKKSHAGRATTLAYKRVEEAWDDKAYKYKIVEATQSGVGDLDQYIFVARDRIDRTTQDKTTFIDIKSVILRDVLRQGCRDFRGISLTGDTPTIDLKVVFHLRSFLRCRRDTAVTTQNTLSQSHLSLFVKYVEAEFQSTDKQLCGLIERNEIIYDLLWALFEPNVKVFTTCAGTDAPSSDSKELEDEDLLICGPTVLGFCLSAKVFLEFAVDHVRDITWSPSSYDNIKLPEAQKKAIWALTQTYCCHDKNPSFKDFVQGKGRGINFLLYGPPGVGKTLTAEIIAESCKLPLYTVAAGQIGVDPVRVENFLTTTFKIAGRWKAILLIDEADVFLAQRSDNPQINALVSVFLRELEHFDGVLFLTTNRVQSFDEAMTSRIHLALKYQPLDQEARKAVWEHFLDQARTSRGSPDTAKLADELADTKLNGREIRNTVLTARSIAEYEGAVVKLSHLKNLIHAREQFQEDFHGAGAVENLKIYT